jgi:DNA-binding Xre family transcriptional regulator/quercetin dioxygenase-like cupin family protein
MEESEPRVGARVRQLRRARGLTVGELASRAGLTAGFISQLERDLTSVSLASLARICAALGVTIGQLLDASPGVVVYRRSDQPIAPPGFEGQEHRLVVTRERRFNATRSRIAPGAGPGEGLYTLPADVELVYVLAGALELRVHDEVFLLEAGDALTYSPRDLHTWRNPSEDRHADVMWFAIPNPYER